MLRYSWKSFAVTIGSELNSIVESILNRFVYLWHSDWPPHLGHWIVRYPPSRSFYCSGQALLVPELQLRSSLDCCKVLAWQAALFLQRSIKRQDFGQKTFNCEKILFVKSYHQSNYNYPFMVKHCESEKKGGKLYMKEFFFFSDRGVRNSLRIWLITIYQITKSQSFEKSIFVINQMNCRFSEAIRSTHNSLSQTNEHADLFVLKYSEQRKKTKDFSRFIETSSQ